MPARMLASSPCAKSPPSNPWIVSPVLVRSGSVVVKLISPCVMLKSSDFKCTSALAKIFRSILSASYSLVCKIESTAIVCGTDTPAVTLTWSPPSKPSILCTPPSLVVIYSAFCVPSRPTIMSRMLKDKLLTWSMLSHPLLMKL